MTMTFTLNFHLYTRLYRQILENQLGIWTSRTGLIVQLEDDSSGRRGYGEIAPFPGFGGECYDQAFAFTNRLCFPIGQVEPTHLTEETIVSIPEELTATRFGFGCALEALKREQPLPLPTLDPSRQSALLQRGHFALKQWQPLWEEGHRTFKWKVGLGPLEQELAWLDQLLASLPAEAKLRLDANGSLTVEQAQVWLDHCDPQRVEFFEQPLDPGDPEALLALAQRSPVPLALDESVSTLADFKAWVDRGWPGVYVVKVPLLGFPWEIREFFESHQLDLVFSSLLETTIARIPALALAEQFQNPQRAMGFGIQTWLDPEDGFEDPDPETIWAKL